MRLWRGPAAADGIFKPPAQTFGVAVIRLATEAALQGACYNAYTMGKPTRIFRPVVVGKKAFARLHARLALSTMLVAGFMTALQYLWEFTQGDAKSRTSSAYWAALIDVLGTSLLVFGIGWVAGVAAVRPFVRRLEQLSEVAHCWEEGELTRRVDEHPRDELSTLAHRLNTMAGQLAQTFALQKSLAVTQERERLAYELHDGVKQQMFALALHLGAARSHCRASESLVGTPLAASLEAAHQLAGQSQRDLLGLVQAWSEPYEGQTAAENHAPEAEAARTLSAFTERLRLVTRTWDNRSGALTIAVSVADPTAPLLLPQGAASELEGVVREALANSVRHANASHVTISVKTALSLAHGTPRLLHVRIADDGRGFDTSAGTYSGLGIAAMRARAARLPGGDLQIKSAPTGGGCCVVATCLLDTAPQRL